MSLLARDTLKVWKMSTIKDLLIILNILFISLIYFGLDLNIAIIFLILGYLFAGIGLGM